MNAVSLSRVSTPIYTQTSINIQRVLQLQREISPVTHPYLTQDGKKIQLWKHPKYIVVASVIDNDKKLIIVPGTRLRNPLNPYETPENLLKNLESHPNSNWDFVFDVHSLSITIWPHLEAAGKDKGTISRPVAIKGSPLRYTSEEELIKLLLRNGYIPKFGDPNAFVNEEKGIEAHIDRAGEGNDPHEPDHLDMKFTKKKFKEIQKQQDDFNVDYEKNEKTKIQKEVKEGKITAREGKNKEHNLEKKLKKQTDTYAKLKAKWRFVYGEKPPILPKGPNPSNPAKKEFDQKLQQTKLDDEGGGTIGGVACGLDYFEGLFDNPQALFEHDHFFCLPCLPKGKLPFSDEELRQILRELAIGIYVHDTIPFFSLHFKQGTSDLFPVIHPAYENTLVGRVIGMLDYFMKGYLNGGVFNEKFVDEWNSHPDWSTKSSSALKELIDFYDYCSKHLPDDEEYYSLGMMQDLKEDKDLDQNLKAIIDSQIEMDNKKLKKAINKLGDLDYSGFRNSFRIIAKQNSIQQSNGLFVLDGDFDVFYTIEPSADFIEKCENVRTEGGSPEIYKTLENSYRNMSRKIHDHMVKMPMCREYFSMLNVINFISGYFSTLKKHRKIPMLPSMSPVNTQGCPQLFPHLPIKTIKIEPLKLNFKSLMKVLIKKNEIDFYAYAIEVWNALVDQPNEQTKEFGTRSHAIEEIANRIKASMYEIAEEQILDSTSFPYKRFLQKNPAQNKIKTSITLCINDIFEFVHARIVSEVNKIKGFPAEKKSDCLNYDHTKERTFLQKIGLDEPNKTMLKLLALFVDSYEDRSLTIVAQSYDETHLSPEISLSQSKYLQGVVGGCGMKLTPQKVQFSSAAQRIWKNEREKLHDLSSETFERITDEQSEKAVFRLYFEDTPAGFSDYSWMESFLLLPENQCSDDKIAIKLDFQIAMSEGNYNNFVALVDETDHLDEITEVNNATLLHCAARLQDPRFTAYLLEKGLSTNTKDSYGFLPVHYAAMTGALETLELLLKHNPDSLNAKSCHQSSPLIVAIQHSQVETVRFLLTLKPTASLLSSGYNDLHCALHEGNLEIIHLLLSNFDHIEMLLNENSQEGGTPLMLACKLDNADLVKKMQEMNAKGGGRPDGVTVINIALKRKCLPVLKVLLKQNKPTALDFKIAAQECSEEFLFLLSSKNGFYHSTLSQDNLLHIALRSGNIPGALWLATQSAFVNGLNVDQETPFELATFLGAWNVAEVLLNHGAVPNLNQLLQVPYHPLVKTIFDSHQIDQDKLQSLLLKALEEGNYLAISQVLKPKGANINGIVGPKGWRALHYLAKCDAIYLFRSEMAYSPSPLMPLVDEGNKTLPYIAAENGSHSVLRLLMLIIKRDNLPLENHFLDRHLMYGAIESGQLNNVKLIQASCEDFLALTLDGNNTRPIPFTAKCGHLEILKEFIHNIKKKSLSTSEISLLQKDLNEALFYAVQMRHVNMIKFLIENHAKIDGEILFKASTFKDQEVISLLLATQPSASCLDHALYIAVRSHDINAFRLLRMHGATTHFVTPKKWTPLLVAARFGDTALLKEILEDPNLVKSSIAGNGALHLAAREGHTDCVELLVSAGFSSSLKNNKNETPLDLANNKNGMIDVLNNKPNRFASDLKDFEKALEEKNHAIIETILDKLPKDETIHVTIKGKTYWGTPLQLFIRFNFDKLLINALIVKYPPKDWNKIDCEGKTLVHLLIKACISPMQFVDLKLDIPDHQGLTPLHYAVTHLEHDEIDELLVKLPTTAIEATDVLGFTPLFYAIRTLKEKNLIALLNKGANANHQTHALVTPLAYAIELSHSMVKILLRYKANINQICDIKKSTPLHIAISHQKWELARYLILRGARTDIPDVLGRYPIHYLDKNKNHELLRLLVAGKSTISSIISDSGMGIAHYAASHADNALLELIYEKDPDALNAPIRLNIEGTNSKYVGMTPLHFAALEGKTDTLKWLLEHYVNPEIKTNQNEDAMVFAAGNSSADKMFALLNDYQFSHEPESILPAFRNVIAKDHLSGMISLIRMGVEINSKAHEENSALHYAAHDGAINCTAWLLQNGGDPYLKNHEGLNVFELSAQGKSTEHLKTLLDLTSVDIDQQYHHKRTLLHLATIKGVLGNVMLLMMQGANLDSVDLSGYTPLHYAVKNGHVEIIKLLLACGADTKIVAVDNKQANTMNEIDQANINTIFNSFLPNDKQNEEGDTYLHLAVRNGHLNAVLVLSQSIDMNAPNLVGISAFELAKILGKDQIYEFLLRLNPNRTIDEEED